MNLDLDTATNLAKQLQDSAGFTYPPPPKSGYMVGGAGRSVQFPWSEVTSGADDDATIHLRTARKIMAFGLPVSGSHYLGCWYNPDDKQVYLEESDHYVTKDLTRIMAKRRKQIAVYDLKRKMSVKLEDWV